jgi:hypothetical protein
MEIAGNSDLVSNLEAVPPAILVDLEAIVVQNGALDSRMVMGIDRGSALEIVDEACQLMTHNSFVVRSFLVAYGKDCTSPVGQPGH